MIPTAEQLKAVNRKIFKAMNISINDVMTWEALNANCKAQVLRYNWNFPFYSAHCMILGYPPRTEI